MHATKKRKRKIDESEEGKRYTTGLKTRPDAQLPQSRVGGQGPYLRSVEHLGRSGIAKSPINAKKEKCDGRTNGWTDGPTDRPTKRGAESRSTQLKIR